LIGLVAILFTTSGTVVASMNMEVSGPLRRRAARTDVGACMSPRMIGSSYPLRVLACARTSAPAPRH
jgi:hypothetical protein